MVLKICPTCSGRGRIKCPICFGEGKVEEGDFDSYDEECPKCKGEKEIDCTNKYCGGTDDIKV